MIPQRVCFGWKGDRPGVHLESRSGELVRSAKITSGLKKKFEGIHDRFQRGSTYRDSQLKIGWTEETCIAMDKLAQEKHSYCPLPEEFERNEKNWYITLNHSGRNAPMKLRSDFREALTNMHRLHRESGEERPEPTHLKKYQRWHSSSSSSSTLWWQWNKHWWSSQIKECQ